MTLDEANFAITNRLVELAQTEGRWPRIVGIHSIEHIGDGEASVWLLLDDPMANAGMGVLWCHVDAGAVLGMDSADILRALTSDGQTKH